MGHKDLFEILAAVEDYIASEETFQRGSELLSRAFYLNSDQQTSGAFRGWRDMVPVGSTSQDIGSLFRLKVTKIIAQLYTTN